MKNREIVVLADLEQLVTENSKIWADYDATRRDCATLDVLSNGVRLSGDVTEPGWLSSEEDVPNEISAIVQELRQAQEEVKDIDRSIQAKTEEIQAIQDHAAKMRIFIGAVVVAIVILAALYFTQVLMR